MGSLLLIGILPALEVNPMLDNIYVINVKKLDQRRRFMQNQLASYGLKADFILDGDIDDLTDDILDKYFDPNNQLSMAQKSCAYKHVLALQKIAQNELNYNLVLEDDAVFEKDFITGLERAISETPQYQGLKVIYIGSGGNGYTPKSRRVEGQYLYPATRGRFADSYMLDAETAKARLDWIERFKIREPIDNQYDVIDQELGIKLLWLEDPIVEQGSKNGKYKSQLEPAPPNLIQAFLFRYEKLRRKYIYQLWR